MRVFSVEMLVKEEGAAVVEAALKKLKNEATAVGAQLKATTTAVTSTGTAMKGAGEGTQIAGDRAAKAAIGFAAVGQSIARTGSLTADAGTRIIEAGSQISAMFGAGGLVVSGILAGLAAVTTAFFATKKEVADFKKTLDGLTDTANIQGLQDELDKLVKGTASKEGKDAITAQATELVQLQEEYKKYANVTGAASSEQIALAKRINELRDEIDAKRQKIDEVQRRIALASDTERFHTEVVDEEAEAEKRATDATKKRTEALKALDEAVKRNALVRGAMMEREAARPAGPSLIDQTTFGTGLQGGITAGLGLKAAPEIVKSDMAALKDTISAEMATLSTDLAKMSVPIDQALLDAVKVDNLQAQLSEGITGALEGGILSGLEMALASGNIGEAFKAMGQAIVSSLAKAMVNVAVAAIKLGTLLEKVRAFMMLNPAIAVASAVALLALARSMGGGASGGSMTAVGTSGGLSYAVGGPSTAVTNPIIFGPTSASTAAGMTARTPMNVTIIGPNDPTAQRAIQELMNKANSRGSIG